MAVDTLLYPILTVGAYFAMTVSSFSSPQFGKDFVPRHHSTRVVALRNMNGSNELNYGMGGQNLSNRWIELVKDGHVTATTVLKDDGSGEKGLPVKYGVRLLEERTSQQRLLEFVEDLSTHEEDENEKSNNNLREHISSIIGTLTEMQQQQSSSSEQNAKNKQHSDNGIAIQCVYDGPYAAQLQLVRTLRPARSREMSSDANEKVACKPPQYDLSNDSFLVGPLRLFGDGDFHGDGLPRERAARLLVARDKGKEVNGKSFTEDASTPWDVFHNISPVGMSLLLVSYLKI